MKSIFHIFLNFTHLVLQTMFWITGKQRSFYNTTANKYTARYCGSHHGNFS